MKFSILLSIAVFGALMQPAFASSNFAGQWKSRANCAQPEIELKFSDRTASPGQDLQLFSRNYKGEFALWTQFETINGGARLTKTRSSGITDRARCYLEKTTLQGNVLEELHKNVSCLSKLGIEPYRVGTRLTLSHDGRTLTREEGCHRGACQSSCTYERL